MKLIKKIKTESGESFNEYIAEGLSNILESSLKNWDLIHLKGDIQICSLHPSFEEMGFWFLKMQEKDRLLEARVSFPNIHNLKNLYGEINEETSSSSYKFTYILLSYIQRRLQSNFLVPDYTFLACGNSKEEIERNWEMKL